MQHGRKPQHPRQAGFTLIEIMVVIIILGVLGAIIVPNVIGQAHTARAQAAQTDMRNISGALDLYKLRFARYPDTGAGIAALYEPPSDPNARGKWPPGGFLPGAPQDPWGNPYIYLGPDDAPNGRFQLISYGADGQEGGAEEGLDLTFPAENR